jgi:hypothetical protein
MIFGNIRVMTIFDRIASESGYKTWDDLLEDGKERNITLNIPLYIQPNFSEVLFETIKKCNFKLFVENDNIILTRDKQEDIITETDKSTEQGDQNV